MALRQLLSGAWNAGAALRPGMQSPARRTRQWTYGVVSKMMHGNASFLDFVMRLRPMKWLFCSALALTPVFAATGYFAPTSRLSGLGIARQEITDLVLAERTRLMIESQSFAILRDP